MTEVEKLREEAKQLRLKVYDLTAQLEESKQRIINASLEGQGYYVFSDDGEANKFPNQREAWLHQLKLQDEGTTSVRVLVQEVVQGIDQSEFYERPPRPSQDPQDVHGAA